jgi:hypothetical protein
MAMTVAQIIGLLAEMIVEDSRQPAISEAEMPSLLEECLRAFEYETQWKRNSAIQVPHSQTIGNGTGQTDAAASSAAHSVNRPVHSGACSCDRCTEEWLAWRAQARS